MVSKTGTWIQYSFTFFAYQALAALMNGIYDVRFLVNISRTFQRSHLLNTPRRLFLNLTNRLTFNLFQAHFTPFFNAFKYIGVFAIVRIRAVRIQTFALSMFPYLA